MRTEVGTELVAFCKSAGDSSPTASVADGIVDSFFNGLREQHVSEALLDGERSDALACKLNQQNLYLDDQRWAAAVAASRRHLEAHVRWTSGCDALSSAELRTRVALQHFTAVDLEDLRLAEAERRSNDSFTAQGISKQFLLDVACSTFVLDGERFCFLEEQAGGSAPRLEAGDAEAVERRLPDFEDRLVAALLRCLGGQPPPALVQGISRSMSQAGVANVERACGGPQLVISGGEQVLCHELRTLSTDVWELRTSLRKSNFEQAVVVDDGSGEAFGKATILPCGAASCISRSCAIYFHLADDELRADVSDVQHEVLLVDVHSRPLPLPGQEVTFARQQWKQPFFKLFRLNLHWLPLGAAVESCTRCRRRARRLVECMPRGIIPGLHLAVQRHARPPEEDGCMMTPLQVPSEQQFGP